MSVYIYSNHVFLIRFLPTNWGIKWIRRESETVYVVIVFCVNVKMAIKNKHL